MAEVRGNPNLPLEDDVPSNGAGRDLAITPTAAGAQDRPINCRFWIVSPKAGIPDSGWPDSKTQCMLKNAVEIVRLGKKGQVSLPRAILRRLGLTGETLLLVDTSPEGSIVLKPAGVYPIELYGEKRAKEFLAEDRITPKEHRRIKRRIRTTR